MNDLRKIIKNWPQLKRVLDENRRKGSKIAFTNGCFDILHVGHVSYLQEAKKPGRILIVGLNTDASVRKIKGKGRPINRQDYRAKVLASLSAVDFITFFNDETPLRLIDYLKPDILIKGADWKGKSVAGSEVVEKHGGRMEFIRYLKGFSTTAMIRKIKQCA